MFSDENTGVDTFEEALRIEEESWIEHICEEQSPRNGEVFTKECLFLLCDNEVEDEMGDAVTVHSVEVTLEYEHYHGDLKEHGYP